MPLQPKFGDSKNNLIAKIAINTGSNAPLIGDGMWNLLYKVCQNTYESSVNGIGYINGKVQTYDNLPIAVNEPLVDSIYIVLQATGIPLINRKESGLYIRRTNSGALSDWEKL